MKKFGISKYQILICSNKKANPWYYLSGKFNIKTSVLNILYLDYYYIYMLLPTDNMLSSHIKFMLPVLLEWGEKK
jgi:hypothetical protein